MTELVLHRFDSLFKKKVTMQEIQKLSETTVDGHMDYQKIQTRLPKIALKIMCL